MLDQVKVDYYGTPTPINQMAQVSAPEPQLITISPWDPSILKEIEKAIQASDLGFNPMSDGKLIRIKEKRCNGKAGSVGAGALIATAGGRINPIHIPYRKKISRDRISCGVSPISFVEFAMGTIDNNQMAIASFGGAIISRHPFHASVSGQGEGGGQVGISGIKGRAFFKGNVARIGVCLNDPKCKVDLHPAHSPSTCIFEPRDDR